VKESLDHVSLSDIVPIVREYVHQGKLSEKPGFMAGGEYQVDYYYDMIRRQMTTIKDDLAEIQKRREESRAKRRKRGSYLIAIAGYTNAGKSCLMNALMEEGPDAKLQESSPEVFTTLSTSTRKMRGGKNRLLIDTVGFISDLPPFLIQGFMSTMEEVFDADIVILVVDGSEPAKVIRRKLSDSMGILREGQTRGNVIIAMNKMDLLGTREGFSEGYLEGLVPAVDPPVTAIVPVSALSGEGLDRLIETVNERLPAFTSVIARYGSTMTMAEIRKALGKRYTVEFESSQGGTNTFRIETDAKWISSLKERITLSGGEVILEQEMV
jgi:GTP-binding protein HflX